MTNTALASVAAILALYGFSPLTAPASLYREAERIANRGKDR